MHFNTHLWIQISGKKPNPGLREHIRQRNSRCDDAQLSESDEEQTTVLADNNRPREDEDELSGNSPVGNMDLASGGLETGNTSERESSGNRFNMPADDRRVFNGGGQRGRERQNIEVIYIRVDSTVVTPAENQVVTSPMPVVHIRSLELGIV